MTFRLLAALVLGVGVAVAALTGLFGGSEESIDLPVDGSGWGESVSETQTQTSRFGAKHMSGAHATRARDDRRDAPATPNPFLPLTEYASNSADRTTFEDPTRLEFDRSPARSTRDGRARERPNNSLSRGDSVGEDRSLTSTPAVEGYQDATQELDDTLAEEQDTTLPRMFAITGRVLDQEGLAVSNIELAAAPIRIFGLAEGYAGPEDLKQLRAVSGSRGVYVFNGLPDGEYRIHTLPTPQYASGQTSVRAGAEFADIVLVGPRRVHVHGVVYSTMGEPIDQVAITPAVTGARSTSSNEYGEYELRVSLRLDAALSIRARRNGFREQTVQLRTSDLDRADISLDITMKPEAMLTQVSGTLQDSNQSPIAAKIVQLRSARLNQIYRARSDAGGRFVMQGVETSDDYKLQIHGDEQHQGYARDDLVVPLEGLELSIVLSRQDTGILFGQMVDLFGVPIPGFSLALRSKHSPYASIRVTADDSGNFFVPNVPAGPLILQTQSAPRLTVEGIALAPGSEAFVPVVLDWGPHQIRGLLVDSNGNPVSASTIILRWSHEKDGVVSWSSRRTAADAQGRFRFERLGPGPHTVRIDLAGFKPTSLDHDVTAQGYDLIVQLEDSMSVDDSASE